VRSDHDKERFCCTCGGGPTEFTPDHLKVLADFCASQDPTFNRKRWIDYITGEGGSGDEMMFVEPDNTLLSGAVVEDKPVRRVNRDEGSPKSGQKRPSAHS
jgi:hypothetical protein